MWMCCCWASLSVLTEGCCHEGSQASVWRSTRRLPPVCRWHTVQVCCQTTGLYFLKDMFPGNPSWTGIWLAGPSDLQSPSGRGALSGAEFPCQLDTFFWRITSNIYTSRFITTTRFLNWHSQRAQLFYTVLLFCLQVCRYLRFPNSETLLSALYCLWWMSCHLFLKENTGFSKANSTFRMIFWWRMMEKAGGKDFTSKPRRIWRLLCHYSLQLGLERWFPSFPRNKW